MGLSHSNLFMLYLDIDGVLRDLAYEAFGFDTPSWDFEVDFKTVADVIDEHPEKCVTAPSTFIVDVVNDVGKPVHILSAQHQSWIPYTNLWLGKHLNVPWTATYTKGAYHKMDYLGAGCYLLDDFPYFSSYKYVVVADHRYNRDVACKRRVVSREDAEKVFKELA